MARGLLRRGLARLCAGGHHLAGVDMLCLGGSKNGIALGEAVVFFNRELARDFDYWCKQGGQLECELQGVSLRANQFVKSAFAFDKKKPRKRWILPLLLQAGWVIRLITYDQTAQLADRVFDCPMASNSEAAGLV